MVIRESGSRPRPRHRFHTTKGGSTFENRMNSTKFHEIKLYMENLVHFFHFCTPFKFFSTPSNLNLFSPVSHEDYERRELKWEFVGVIPFSAGSSAVHQFTSTSGGGTRWRICWAGIRGHLFRPWLETLSVTITCETWRATTCRGC